MRTTDFDFDLPPEQIAQQPAEPRDSSRLMVLHRCTRTIEHRIFSDLPDYLRQGDILVRNNTRVMAGRLTGVRCDTGGHVEALLVRQLDATPTWEVMMRPARQARPGREFAFGSQLGELRAVAVRREDDLVVLRFETPFDAATAGEIPLPPYITGYTGDRDRYQTVYASDARSAAAPTAGLHFTPALLERIANMGVQIADVSLDVGPGTFQPVKVDDPRDHQLHQEHIEIPGAAAQRIGAARQAGGRVVAVGTTVVRTLEHVAREQGTIRPHRGWTGLKMLPGDEFRAVDALVTNFHLPKSTLLMLVCAFAGTEFVLHAYREAVAMGYRFYSFGDAMLLLP